MANNRSDAGDSAYLSERAIELRQSGVTADDKWMLDLHRDLTARFISDNTRIWTSGSIFVGIAFASLAISPDSIGRGAPAYAVAITSVALVVIWNLIADRLRQFQERAFRWIEAIEKVYLPESAPVATRLPFLRIQSLRWSLSIVLAIGWSIRLGLDCIPDGFRTG
jgi:hypothetical protein